MHFPFFKTTVFSVITFLLLIFFKSGPATHLLIEKRSGKPKQEHVAWCWPKWEISVPRPPKFCFFSHLKQERVWLQKMLGVYLYTNLPCRLITLVIIYRAYVFAEPWPELSFDLSRTVYHHPEHIMLDIDLDWDYFFWSLRWSQVVLRLLIINFFSAATMADTILSQKLIYLEKMVWVFQSPQHIKANYVNLIKGSSVCWAFKCSFYMSVPLLATRTRLFFNTNISVKNFEDRCLLDHSSTLLSTVCFGDIFIDVGILHYSIVHFW